MSESIDDVFRAIRRRERFKLRYATRGSAASEQKIPYYEWSASNDFSASLTISTTSREDIGESTRWAFEAEYAFSVRTYNLTQGWVESGARCTYELTEREGAGDTRTTGYLEAACYTGLDSVEYVSLAVFLDPAPIRALTYTHHEKSDSYSCVGEKTQRLPHQILFGLIAAQNAHASPMVELPGFGFRRASFRKFKAWQDTDWMCALPDLFDHLPVIRHREIALSDGDELPTLEDCVPVIEVLEEHSGLPISGKTFKIRQHGGEPVSHVTDEKGQIRLFVENDEEFEVVEMEEHPEFGEPHHLRTEP